MPTVSWDPSGPSIKMIDQRVIPQEVTFLELGSLEQLIDAIKSMAVRGAPAIGAAAAYGLALAAMQSEATSVSALRADLEQASRQLVQARPTAVNLKWAVERVMLKTRQTDFQELAELKSAVLKTALSIAEQDVLTNRKMAAVGAALLPDPSVVIHHCNTGALATVDHGTALGVVRTAHEQGKDIHVLVDETRPRLQGARLTAWELEQAGVPYDIITDNAAGYFLARREVDAVLVGADRIAANGDVANKIGTYMLALAAHDNGVPFYCVAPTSTFDLNSPTGDAIPIEERDPREVLNLEQQGRPVAPADSTARNPAFDITPHRLITAFITERGVLREPFLESIHDILQMKDASL
ncbi:MAG: S-methyl-5-thioribose-1-phosphate isomerase [Anaerolineales bacterium]|jgi:methylthioribose-1-phosphate isomerase